MNPPITMSYDNTLKPLALFVAQTLYNGMTLPGSGSSSTGWWWTSCILFVTFIVLITIDSSYDNSYDVCVSNAVNDSENAECLSKYENRDSDSIAIFGMSSCCGSVVTAIIALSVGGKKQTIIIQQMPQMYAAQPVIQQIIQQPAQQIQGQMPLQQRPPVPKSPPVPARTQPQSNQGLEQQAKNLEMARDFEGAADMFQKAGLFAEAGRVRQKFLEKEDKPVVQIGQVGNSVVQDSVIMAGAAQSNVCQSCSSAIQPDWKFCPSCNAPI